MIRTFVLADVITLANAGAGMAAILLSLAYVAGERGAIVWAMALAVIALVCDAADGAVARWRRKHSPLGADLDSLADVVSFGVAPAVMGFALGLRGLWDGLILVYFVACGVSRLARYNVTAASLSDDRGKVRYYEGTPIPTSLAIVALLALAFGLGAVHDAFWLGQLRIGPGVLHPIALVYALSGSLMISTLRIPKP